MLRSTPQLTESASGKSSRNAMGGGCHCSRRTMSEPGTHPAFFERVRCEIPGGYAVLASNGRAVSDDFGNQGQPAGGGARAQTSSEGALTGNREERISSEARVWKRMPDAAPDAEFRERERERERDTGTETDTDTGTGADAAPSPPPTDNGATAVEPPPTAKASTRPRVRETRRDSAAWRVP